MTQNNDFRALLAAKGLSEDQQKQVLAKLDQAVALNALGLLHDNLTEEHKAALAEQKPQTLEELSDFLATRVPQEKAKLLLQQAADTIVEKFLQRI